VSNKNELLEERKMMRIFTVLAVFLIVTGCTQAPPSTDPSVITSRSDAWDDALNAKDIDALVELYTSDARVLPPNNKMQTGRDAVRAEFGAMIDAGLGGELTSIETTVYGDIGYNVGTFSIRDGDQVVDTGKFIETWRRGDDGVWRISNDIYNSDGAMPAGGGETSHLMILHKVADTEHWLAAWRGADGRRNLFEANGAEHVHTFRSVDDPNLTGLVIKVSDMVALQGMIDSEEGRAAAEEDGVDRTLMMVLTEAE
jgi:ketosteroid isomerase-like protein